MANTTNFSVRMDSDIKKQCEALYGQLGMNLTAAINVFPRHSFRLGGFPFKVRLEQPNRETIVTMLEAKQIAQDPWFNPNQNIQRFIWQIRCRFYLKLQEENADN